MLPPGDCGMRIPMHEAPAILQKQEEIKKQDGGNCHASAVRDAAEPADYFIGH
jgi:hypothetical protein